MEILFEFLLELALETGIEAATSLIRPRAVRWILLAVIAILFLAAVGLVVFIGASVIQKSLLGGMFIMLTGAGMLAAAIVHLKKAYLKRKANSEPA